MKKRIVILVIVLTMIFVYTVPVNAAYKYDAVQKGLEENSLNVKWFGAKGNANYYKDGKWYQDSGFTKEANDDSQAFQKAIDEIEKSGGGTLLIPKGKYVVTNLKIRKSEIRIVGIGMSSVLVNTHKSNPMLTIDSGDGKTLYAVSIENLKVWNTVNRTQGDYPLIYAKLLVGSRFSNIRFDNTQVGGTSAYYASCMKLEDAFEVGFYDIVWRMWQRGYAVDMPNTAYNVGNIVFTNCSWFYNGQSLIYARGKGSLSNTITLVNPKFVGWQGGGYARDKQNKYALAKVESSVSNSNTIPINDISGFQSGQTVLVGSNERVTPAVVLSVSGNNLVLDRNVTVNSDDRILQGKVAMHVGWRAREVEIIGGHFEGLDVGVDEFASMGMISIRSGHVSSTLKTVLVNYNPYYLMVENVTGIGLGQGLPYEFVSIQDLKDKNNTIIVKNVFLQDGLFGKEVVNNTNPKLDPVIITDSLEGGQKITANSRTAIKLNRSDNTKFARIGWQENSKDKWNMDYTGINGDLVFQRQGQPASLSMSGQNGNVILGGTWNGSHLVMGNYHFWVDGSGKLRSKDGAPTEDLDGTLVGS